MGEFKEIFMSYGLAGLLVLSIFFFVLTLQIDNNAEEVITDNTLLNESFGQLQEDLGGMGSQSQAQRELFEEEKPTAGFGSLILFSIVSSGKVFTGMIVGTFDVLIKLPMIIFGVNPIVSSILSTILLVVMILALWSLYKLGG